MNMRDRLKANTANLTPAADREVTETAAVPNSKRNWPLKGRLARSLSLEFARTPGSRGGDLLKPGFRNSRRALRKSG